MRRLQVASFTFRYEVTLHDAEADGSPCRICEDPVYFRAKRAVVVINGLLTGRVTLRGMFCWGCGDEVQKRIDENKGGEG